MSCGIYEIWDELCSQLFTIAPAYRTRLARSATERAINAVQRNLGISLPPAYAEFLRIHNGTCSQVFIAFELFGVADIRAATHAMRLESQASEQPFLEGGWDQQKLLVGDSQIGWKLVVDCETGAVFVYDPNNYADPLADSFEGYLSGLRDNLRNQHYQLIDDEVFMEAWGARWG